MRDLIRTVGAIIPLLIVFGANGGPGDAPAADCTFDPHQLRSSRELWHELSGRAELVAPTRATTEATTTGRRRSVAPPSTPAQTFQSRNFRWLIFKTRARSVSHHSSLPSSSL